uniref:Uncharacterized protein n=1 Tax=Anguilla anguilla TaxID=7936 RepID=A0A0E9WE27_ANGAN
MHCEMPFSSSLLRKTIFDRSHATLLCSIHINVFFHTVK